jgi:hypothetical protein
MQSASIIQGIDPNTVSVFDQLLDASPANTHVGRTDSIKLSAVDMLVNSSTDLGSVTIKWGSTTSWEVSMGVLFSTLPNRTFQTSPLIVNGQPQPDASGKTNTIVTETISRPTVVPLALGHFRVRETAIGDKRVAFLLSGGIGISPYSGVTDFASGVTVSYRLFMLSPLVHFGRDVRLTNGLAVGQTLGSSPPTLTTERYWVKKFGLALTIRLPF